MDEILKAIAQVGSDIKALDKKIDNVESKLSQKIDSVDTGLRTLIDLEVNTKIQIIADSQVGIIEKVEVLPDMQDDISEMKDDIAVITAALKTHIHD